MFKIFINPSKFNQFSDIIFKPLLYLSLITLTIGLYFALYLSPNDYLQGSTVRIMYIHVPSAWLSLLTFFIMTIYSILALTFKITFGYIFIKAVAPIGLIFTLMCLITGSIWGKPMWGTWWVWDARLTSVLILGIFYIIIMILNRSFDDIENGEKISTIFVLLGSINLPIIKFSVDWWNTLHQPASISKLASPSIEISLLLPLIVMTIAFKVLFLFLISLRVRAEINIRKQILKE